MTVSVTNRETVRDALATALDAALVTSGFSAGTVVGYQVADFGAASPVVVVTATGADRSRFNDPNAVWQDELYFAVHLFVLYADGTVWTEAQSEDQLDLLEKTVSDYVLGASAVGGADEIWIDGRTTLEALSLGGHDYRHEIIPVRVGKLHQS